jgi:hypothetical protein
LPSNGPQTAIEEWRFLRCGRRFADDKEVETEVRKWLRQQSNDFYAVSFDAPVKRWDKCIGVSGGYVEI